MELDKQIEAILFWKGESMTIPELCRALKQPSGDVKRALQTLTEKLSGRGIALIQAGDTFALATAGETHETIERLRKEELSRDLGKAALEILSIVLYKGKASRRGIEHIRGVNSTAILRSLLIRGLVERTQNESDDLPAPDRALHAGGRSPQAGRAFFYRPTVELLSLLGIHDVAEMPELAAVRAELEAAESEQKTTGSAVEDDEISEAAHD